MSPAVNVLNVDLSLLLQMIGEREVQIALLQQQVAGLTKQVETMSKIRAGRTKQRKEESCSPPHSTPPE